MDIAEAGSGLLLLNDEWEGQFRPRRGLSQHTGSFADPTRRGA